jgi:sulfite reductase beta subunit-like hemoprotein
MTTNTETTERAPSHVEEIKTHNPGLGGILLEEAADLHTPSLSEDASIVLKFHGSYQQDDRDQRKALKKAGQDRAWSFMVRTKCSGGQMTAEQYLLADELAGSFANGTLRITTRQAIQFHGIGKANLKPLIKALNERWVTTYGACGDVVRNVLTCPVADLLPDHHFDLQTLARQVSDRFLPESTAYYELWLDGEKVLADGKKVKIESSREESFYGTHYLPRKHKLGIGLPNDNCVDMFTHDLALEAIVEDGELRGFNLLAGGGLGSTHGKKETFPRLGDRIGFLPPEQALAVLEAASAIYRDYGDRSNRKHARLKYVLEDHGVAWFQQELALRLGWALGPAAPVDHHDVHDHLGWQRQADGDWMVGVWVENGRIKDADGLRLRSGLRAIVAAVQPEIRLTAQQNLVLARIAPEQRATVEALLEEYGILTGEPAKLSALRRYAMACPALPTCSLAVAEAERYLPGLIGELEQRGYGEERVWIRMSGCPNSCSRPPTAEIGLIGRSLGLYNVYVGGSFAGTRLARLYRAEVRSAELPDLLAGLLEQWRNERSQGEAFGDWADRALVANATWHQ